jgi:hypothetical protein
VFALPYEAAHGLRASLGLPPKTGPDFQIVGTKKPRANKSITRESNMKVVTKVWECSVAINAGNNCSLGVPSMSTWGSIYMGVYMYSLQYS